MTEHAKSKLPWILGLVSIVALGAVLIAAIGAPQLRTNSLPMSAPVRGNADLAAEQNNAGVHAHDQGQFDQAIQNLQSALALDPLEPMIRQNLIRALNSRSAAAADAGDEQAAERDLRAALQLDPNHQSTLQHLVVFLNNRAVAAMRERRFVDAHLLYDRVKDLLPRLQDSSAAAPIRVNFSNLLAAEADGLAAVQRDDQARALFEKALALDPRNAEALAALGDLEYQADKYTTALHYYERALQVAPADRTQLRGGLDETIKTLQKELYVEAGFAMLDDPRGRFRVFFPKTLPTGMVAGVLAALNEAYAKIGKDFDFYSTRPVTAKIYSRPQLAQIQNLPQWVAGLYDGKLRLVDDSLQQDPESLRRSLFHEYTHAVIHMMGGEHVPSWLHEGLAQIEEPGRMVSFDEIQYLANQVRMGQAASMKEMSRPFPHSGAGEEMPFVYLQSRMLSEYMLRRYGWQGIRQLLLKTRERKDFDQAFEATFGATVPRIEADWKKWLAESATPRRPVRGPQPQAPARPSNSPPRRPASTPGRPTGTPGRPASTPGQPASTPGRPPLSMPANFAR
jgi:tetratricopeptide (TPR) repeat protein